MNHFWFANRLYKVIFFTSSLPCENETKTYISSDKEREEFRMRKFKKALAFALASAMIVSAVPASAAAKTNSAKGTKSTIYTYTVDKSKKADANNKRSWIKVTAKKGYTYKLVNKTKDIVSLTKTRVEAKKTGTAKINVNFYKNGKYVETKSVKITVKKAPMIGKVTLDKSEITVGETTKVSNAGKGTAYFYSSNKDVATVDKTTGEITAKAAGTTTISAVNTITKARVYLTLTVNAQLAAKQTGSKEITLTGTNFTKDTAVTVKRGNTVVSIDTANVTASSDGKTLVLPTKSVITAAEYTVTVGDKTVNFTGEASKIAKIDVSDVAVVNKGVTLPIASNATASGATITYRVLNQFDEELTKTTDIQVNASRKAEISKKGTIDVTLNAYDKADDVISVVLINTATGISVTKEVKISNAATANEVTVQGIYNESGKTLSEDTMTSSNDFYLLLDVVDQYGNNMANDKFTVGTDMEADLIASAAPGVTNVTLDVDKKTPASVKTVNGHDYVAIKLKKVEDGKPASAGTVSLVLITKLGKTFTGSFEVANGVKVDTFSLSATDIVVAGKETVFDFTALDTQGNDISDKVTKEMFSELTKNSLFDAKNAETGYFKFVKDSKTGKNQLVFDATKVPGKSDSFFVGSFITATGKTANVQFTIKGLANPVSLESKDDFAMIARDGSKATLNAKDVKVTDQYGTNYAFKEFSSAPKAGEYTLVLTTKTTSPAVKVDTTTDATKATFTGSKTVGTTTFTLTLYDGTKEISSEDFNVVTKSLDDVVTNASDVTVSDMPKMHYQSERKLTVKAKVNGMEVTLEAGEDYKVLTNDVDTGKVVSGGAINTNSAKAEVAGKYTIIIGNTAGTEITKDVTVCTEAPKATSAEVKSDAEELTTVSGTTKDIDVSTVLKQLTVKDQYGATMTDLNGARVAFSDYGDNKVENNNTTGAIVKLPANSSVTAKVTFVGGYTFTTTIVVSANS